MRRRRLTKQERADMLERQGGCCVVFGCTETKNLIEEHSTPWVWTGEKADQLMCATHHSLKTPKDVRAIAKVKRIQKRERGEVKKKRAIKSRGFDRTKRKRMDGTVEPRTK